VVLHIFENPSKFMIYFPAQISSPRLAFLLHHMIIPKRYSLNISQLLCLLYFELLIKHFGLTFSFDTAFLSLFGLLSLSLFFSIRFRNFFWVLTGILGTLRSESWLELELYDFVVTALCCFRFFLRLTICHESSLILGSTMKGNGFKTVGFDDNSGAGNRAVTDLWYEISLTSQFDSEDACDFSTKSDVDVARDSECHEPGVEVLELFILLSDSTVWAGVSGNIESM